MTAMVAAVRTRVARVEQQLAPVRARVAGVDRRLAPVRARAIRLEKRVVRKSKRVVTRAKRRITRMTWIARLRRLASRLTRRLSQLPGVARLQRVTSAVPGVQTPVVLAALTAALAVWPGSGPVVGILALWQVVRVLQICRRRPPGATLTTAALVAGLSCAVSLGVQGTATVWVALLAGISVVVALAQGPLHQLVTPRIRAFRLPGVPSDTRAQVPGALVSVVPGIGVLIALLAIAASIWDVPSYVGAVALLVALGWLARCGVRLRAMVRASQDGTADREVVAALERYAPQFLIYFSGPVAGDYQLRMWLPYLEQLGVPFAILARSAQMLPRAARLKTSAPLISCPVVTGLDDCMVQSVRTVFYVNINGSIADGVRYIDRTHVHLNHGDSDKPASYHPIFAMFDRNFVAGPAAIDRFERHGVHMPREKCVIVGRPQVAGVTEDNGHPVSGRRTVLYAPTWQSGMREMSLSSLEDGERIVRTLMDGGARVIFRPHPLSAGQPDGARAIARINALLTSARSPQCPHLTSGQALKEGIIGNFNRSDALVTDVSSVASDYLASCKPMAVVLPTGTQQLADAQEYPVLRATYLVDLGEDDLAAGLAPVLGAEPDPLESVRQELRAYYLGDERDSLRLFLDAARSALEGKPEPVAG